MLINGLSLKSSIDAHSLADELQELKQMIVKHILSVSWQNRNKICLKIIDLTNMFIYMYYQDVSRRKKFQICVETNEVRDQNIVNLLLYGCIFLTIT